jgi:hypothetical protein
MGQRPCAPPRKRAHVGVGVGLGVGVGVGCGCGGSGRDLVLKVGEDFLLQLHLVVCARARTHACQFKVISTIS